VFDSARGFTSTGFFLAVFRSDREAWLEEDCEPVTKVRMPDRSSERDNKGEHDGDKTETDPSCNGSGLK